MEQRMAPPQQPRLGLRDREDASTPRPLGCTQLPGRPALDNAALREYRSPAVLLVGAVARGKIDACYALPQGPAPVLTASVHS